MFNVFLSVLYHQSGQLKMILRQAQQADRGFNCSNETAQEIKRRFKQDRTRNTQNKRTTKTNKVATLNICGLGNKETEAVSFKKTHDIKIMGLSDCRKNGNNMREIHENYVLTWSGVSAGRKAKHGVGFIIHPLLAKAIVDTTFISERIMTIRLKDSVRTTTLIQVYAPCNDSYTEQEKDDFFSELSSTIHSINETDDLIVMGDFNGRVGGRRPPWETYLGPHSDSSRECNNNGEHLLNLCVEHGLFLTNTFFKHRPSHTQTWYKWNEISQTSQIDFILTRLTKRRSVTDSKVIPNVSLDTDHRPVVLYLQHLSFHKLPHTLTTEVIDIKKLTDEDIKSSVKQEMEAAYQHHTEILGNIEESWQHFKITLLKILENKCGITKKGGTRKKRTVWWNDQVKEAVREKKTLFKNWIQTREEEDYNKYKQARHNTKKIIRKSKEESWNNYGNMISELCSKSPRYFYKSIRAMRLRDESFNPNTTINDTDGRPIFNETKIKARWELYFKELLNPRILDETTPLFITTSKEYTEPSILEQEVRETIKKSPNSKATGTDNIPADAIKACEEVGVKWLTKIFNQAWQERKVPQDWQRAVVVPIWKNKGSKKECSTYRGISLLSHVGKMYAKILEQRIRHKVEPLLSESQFGFRKGRGCTDAIFALRQLSEKAIEYNKELDFAFIDQEKAFDRVNRSKLWRVLEEYSVNGQLLDNIRALYEKSESAVRTTVGMTNWLPITAGV